MREPSSPSSQSTAPRKGWLFLVSGGGRSTKLLLLQESGVTTLRCDLVLKSPALLPSQPPRVGIRRPRPEQNGWEDTVHWEASDLTFPDASPSLGPSFFPTEVDGRLATRTASRNFYSSPVAHVGFHAGLLLATEAIRKPSPLRRRSQHHQQRTVLDPSESAASGRNAVGRPRLLPRAGKLPLTHHGDEQPRIPDGESLTCNSAGPHRSHVRMEIVVGWGSISKAAGIVGACSAEPIGSPTPESSHTVFVAVV